VLADHAKRQASPGRASRCEGLRPAGCSGARPHPCVLLDEKENIVTPEAHAPRHPLRLASDAPLLDGCLRFRAAVDAGTTMPFTIPGHKQRTHLVGEVVRGDVPLYAGLDTMKQDGGLLVKAEQRAAAAWGVDWCRLSVAGATHANQAAVLALGRPGQDVVIT